MPNRPEKREDLCSIEPSESHVTVNPIAEPRPGTTDAPCSGTHSSCESSGNEAIEATGSPDTVVRLPTDDDAAPEETHLLAGWRRQNSVPSLPEANSTVSFPAAKAPWILKLAAFFGVGFMVSVGYQDPGNWATDLEGGSRFGYTLLIVVLLSNFMAMFLQALGLKLGVVGERDLAQACRAAYPRWVCYLLWAVAEVAIAATDLAEVIGSATALYLLFNIPLWAGVLITAVDVLVILVLGMKNLRLLELLVFGLVSLIFGIFVYELSVAHPNWADVGKGFIPRLKIITDAQILYVAISILGATVMPHNLFLHSSIIQTRNYPRTVKGKRCAIKYGAVDSTVCLGFAFFINAAILILAAAAFYYGSAVHGEVATLVDAYHLLAPAVGSKAAKILFAVALLAAGQNSSITGTLAGQIVMEGFLNIRLAPWLRRALTRCVAIIPASIVSGVSGNQGAGRLLVLSQVILSLALPFGVIPLVQFTSSRAKMGPFVNGWVITIIGCFIALVITGLNGYLVVTSIINNEFGSAAGH